MPFFNPPMLIGVRAPAAAAYVTRGGPGAQTGSNPYTWSGVSIGAAASDRLVIVSVGWAGLGTVTLSSATIGGVSATIVAQTTGTNTGIAIIAAVVPTGTTADIVVTMSAGMSRFYYAVWRGTGFVSTTAYDTDAPAGGASSARSATIDVPAGGFVFATSQGADSGGVTWTNVTEDWDYSDSNDKHNGGSASSSTLQSGLSVSVSSARCICAASWQ